ncbi:DUF883 domain-containing protein [Kiritimatiellota bacterium B12222]|nr:DUF883 domain-containing protein [Kiritimatiellota bacterium B12222]
MNKQDAQKINEALELLNEAAKGQKDELNSLLSDKYSDLKNSLSGLESTIEDKAGNAAERLRELKASAASQASETASQVDHKVHEEPWKTLGLTVLASLALGVFIGRKDS